MNCPPPEIKSTLKNFPSKFRITVSGCKTQPVYQEKSKKSIITSGDKLVIGYLNEANRRLYRKITDSILYWT
jgi:hypothetical protein